MIDKSLLIAKMAIDAYRSPLPTLQIKLNALEKWPSTRIVTRLVGVREARRRLVKEELAELVWMGFVLVFEIENGQIYPVRTWDLMTGMNSDHMIEIAKADVQLARALKGDHAPLDEMI